MEAKQYVTKQPMDHWRNQRGNQKIPTDKWQWKQVYSENPKPKHAPESVETEFYSDTS